MKCLHCGEDGVDLDHTEVCLAKDEVSFKEAIGNFIGPTTKPEVIVVLQNGQVMDIHFLDCPKGLKVIVRDFDDPPDESLDEQVST